MVCSKLSWNGFGQGTNQINRTRVAVGVNKVKCLITKLALQRHGKTKYREFRGAVNRYGKSGRGVEGMSTETELADYLPVVLRQITPIAPEPTERPICHIACKMELHTLYHNLK